MSSTARIPIPQQADPSADRGDPEIGAFLAIMTVGVLAAVMYLNRDKPRERCENPRDCDGLYPEYGRSETRPAQLRLSFH